jgi:hypothetical protein
MSYNPALVAQIKKQSPSKGIEEALLLGSYYESSIGTNPLAWQPGGVPDEGGQSYGPFFFRDPGALNTVMEQTGMTQAQAGAWITDPTAVNAVQAAEQRYQYVATTQNINPNQSPYEAMVLATQAEVGVGEQNALASGAWQNIYTQDVQPLLGKLQPQQPTLTVPDLSLAPGAQISQTQTNGNTITVSNPLGYGQTGAQADAIAQADLLMNPPSTYKGMSNQMAATMYQQMNPVVHGTGTDTAGNTKPAAGIISDVEGFLTGGLIGSDQYAPLHMAFGVNLKGAAESVLEQPVNNAWNAVKSGLVRFGIGLAGLLLMAAGLFIIVTGVSGSTGMPIPVPV